MTVYADLLFIVNLYIDALLLSAVRRFLRLPLTGKRLLLASVLGGVFGLSALLPALPGVVLFPLTLLESLALCAAAFAPKPMTQLLKAVFLLFLFGAALSGLLTAAAYFLPIHGILLANGAVYFNISALTLILLTCVSYGVLYGFDRLFRKKEPDVFFAKLTITRQGKTVTLPAKIDTGLTLTEPFSGTPAIVADRCALGDILPPNFGMQSTENAVSMRLIPFSSLGADGVLPAFQPDAASLSGISIECWVAVTDRTLSAGSFQALVGTAVCDAAQIQGLKPGKDIP